MERSICKTPTILMFIDFQLLVNFKDESGSKTFQIEGGFEENAQIIRNIPKLVTVVHQFTCHFPIARLTVTPPQKQRLLSQMVPSP